MQSNQARNLVSLLLEKHGIRAPAVAQHEALKAREKGDRERAVVWAEAALLAEEALRAEPS
jgi:hypothetical protein